ncbi:hypothetical protein K435DRAFT_813434, partial [Dendrothele bispora CBS 962.96]
MSPGKEDWSRYSGAAEHAERNVVSDNELEVGVGGRAAAAASCASSVEFLGNGFRGFLEFLEESRSNGQEVNTGKLLWENKESKRWMDKKIWKRGEVEKKLVETTGEEAGEVDAEEVVMVEWTLWDNVHIDNGCLAEIFFPEVTNVEDLDFSQRSVLPKTFDCRAVNTEGDRNIHWAQHCPYRNAPPPRPKKRARLSQNEVMDGELLEVVSEELETDLQDNGDNGILDNPPEEQTRQPLRLSARSKRSLPGRYQNLVISSRSALVKSTHLPREDTPDDPPPFPTVVDLVDQEENPLVEPPEDDQPRTVIFYYQTSMDEYGVFKNFESTIPSADPDEFLDLEQTADAPTFTCFTSESARTYSDCFGVRLDENRDTETVPAPFVN